MTMRNIEFEKVVNEGVDKCLNSLEIPEFLSYKSADITNQIRELLSRAAFETECKRRWDVQQGKSGEVEVISLDNEYIKIEPCDE